LTPVQLRLAAVLCATVACSLLVTPAAAQLRKKGGGWHGINAGVRGGRDFENHAWSLGAQAVLPLQNRIAVRPSGDYFLGDRSPFRWQLNADATLSFGPRRSVYGGAGAAFTRVRALSGVKTGYNLFFGVVSEAATRRKVFLEFRWTFVNRTSPFRLVLGINQAL
jgi:opacity protein-like surface antigen